MPGRQAHGRPLIAVPKSKAASKKSKARSQHTALDAFGIAQKQFPTQLKKTPRARELDADIERKHGRDDDDEEEQDEQEDSAPARKKAKGLTAQDDVDFGSDSEGNEWRLGGLAEDDNDSEIESDDAFGESDNEKFQGYSFRGSKSHRTEDDSEDDSQDDQGETLGDEAIDLATALDQFEDESDEVDDEADGDAEQEEEDSDDESPDQTSSEEDDEQDEDEDGEEEVDPDRLKALRHLVSDYAGEQDGEDGGKVSSRSNNKIRLGDLDLSGLSDPFMSKSVKLLKKEEKEKRPGASKKLAVPLARRQQDRLDRAVAYEKTNETLNRWSETVKQNRLAEHLMFPLPQNSAMAGLDTTEIRPLTQKSAVTELETTILSIMEQSGLSMEKRPSKPKPHEIDEDGNVLSRKEAIRRKREERERNDREAKRAKRIKKIKSKAYHRVHRKERERREIAQREDMEEAGEIDSEAEREAQDRRRALERVGQRHKDSKWAKMGSKVKRAVWDDDFRTGLTEMALRDEELRRRKEGKRNEDENSDDTSSSGSDVDEDDRLRRELDELEREDEDDEPRSWVMGLKFMQRAEAAKRAAEDDMVRQLRRHLDGEEDDVSSEQEPEEIGRRSYGSSQTNPTKPAASDPTKGTAARRSWNKADASGDAAANRLSKQASSKQGDGTVPIMTGAPTAAPMTSGWSQNKARRHNKERSSAKTVELDLAAADNATELELAATNAPVKAPPRPARARDRKPDADQDSESESELHLPLAIRDVKLLEKAFGGGDVEAEFESEKQAVQEADDDKIVDSTLPGWGSWVGEGVSRREKQQHSGRFLTRVEGVKIQDRKDAKLERVIINEKHVKKNDRYRASQLPHPYESRQQYERALRLPVGPEWMTKQTFQESTKPRVLVKQGIIAPMYKPTA